MLHPLNACLSLSHATRYRRLFLSVDSQSLADSVHLPDFQALPAKELQQIARCARAQGDDEHGRCHPNVFRHVSLSSVPVFCHALLLSILFPLSLYPHHLSLIILSFHACATTATLLFLRVCPTRLSVFVCMRVPELHEKGSVKKEAAAEVVGKAREKKGKGKRKDKKGA